jgi:hypothetical protein
MLDEGLITKLCEEIELRFEALAKSEAPEEPQPRGRLYHYTTADGLLGIIQTGQVWATNILYLNDASELSDARAIVQNELFDSPLKLGENAAAIQIDRNLLNLLEAEQWTKARGRAEEISADQPDRQGDGA